VRRHQFDEAASAGSDDFAFASLLELVIGVLELRQQCLKLV
jgi:hypothetical protein